MRRWPRPLPFANVLSVIASPTPQAPFHLPALPRRRRSWRVDGAASAARAWGLACDAIAADQDRLVLWLPPLIGAGILVYVGLWSEPPLWAGGAPCLASLLALLCARRSRLAHALAAAALAVSLGFLAAQLSTRRMPPMPVLPRKAALVSGQVGAVDLMADGRRRLTLSRVGIALAVPPPDQDAAPPAPTERMLRIRLRPDDATRLVPGARVAVRALLRAPAPPSYPGGRDPQRDAFFGDLAGSGRALSAVAVLAPAGADGPGPWLRRLRERIAARIQAVLPGPRGAVAATLLTGLSSAIPQSDRDAFAASGLAHLLAVAGLHLGIVMGLFLTLVRAGLAAWEWGALRLPCRQIAALAALAAGAGYMLLTGLHLPGLRALAMAAVAMLGLVIGRRAVSLRALGFAAAALLLCSPALILEVGYQMSFAAVLALLAGYEAVRPLTVSLHRPGWRPRIALHVFQLFFTSLVAGAASLPYAAFHFGRVQFYFVLANLVAVPLTAFWVLPQGMLALLAFPFRLDAPFLQAMGWGIDLILDLARLVAGFPAASLAVPAPPAWGLLVVSAGLIWLCLWRRPWRLLAVLPLALGCASPWLSAPPDLLVSGDAGLIAIREQGRMVVAKGGRADPMTLEDWRRAWALPAGDDAADEAPDGLPDAGATGDLVCNPAACLLTRHGETVLLLRPPPGRGRAGEVGDPLGSGLLPGDCDGVALLVSPAPAHGACPGVRRIDRFTVWREGPQAVWLETGRIRVWRALGDRGARPWVPEAPGHERPTLPLATAE